VAHIPDGVTLCNGRGIHDASTAELAVGLTLASLRGIPDFVRAQDRGEWAPRWRPALADRSVLLVGYGAIGAAIEARLAPFEAEVVRVARSARDGVHAVEELPALLPEADVVILCLPLTDSSRGLVDATFLARMRRGSLLVNVARGAVVVTDDLVAALHDGHVQAAVDVTEPEPLPDDSPLWSAPGLLVSPHVGGASSAMWPRAHRVVRDQLHRYAAGEPLANVMGDLS
jgi:phosphoglycerate dehydrogenase-like enzyme